MVELGTESKWDVHVRGLVNELAIFLHSTQHKSQRIVMCRSDLAMARGIVDLLFGENWIENDPNAP